MKTSLLSYFSISRTNLWKSLAILLLGLGLTAIATLVSKNEVKSDADKEFTATCNEIKSVLSVRLHDHAAFLRSGAALFNASDSVIRHDWAAFYKRSKIEKNLPGIQGIGYAMLIQKSELQHHIESIRSEGFPSYSVKPEGDRAMYTSIIYLEPFKDRNLRAFGYDMLSEPVRRKAMQTACDSDVASLSSKVTLVQETNKDVQAGTLMYVPVYRHDMPTATVEQRRAAIKGWVYSPYRMNDMMHGILGAWDSIQHIRIRLQVYDNDSLGSKTLLYDSQKNDTLANSPLLSQHKAMSIDFNGKHWLLKFTQSDPQNLFMQGEPLTIMLSGVLLSLLLFFLSFSLFNTRYRARQMATVLTSDLKESELKYRSLIENTSDVVFCVDENGKYKFTNIVFAKTFGKTPDYFIGKTFWDIYPKAEADYRFEAVKEMFRTGEVQAIEVSVPLPDRTLYFLSKLNPIKDETGKVILNLTTATDITERKLAEEKLKEQNQFINSLIDLNPELIYIFDIVDQENIYSNNGIATILGYSVDEVHQMQNKLLSLIMHPDDFDYYIQVTLPKYVSLKDDEHLKSTYRLKSKTGNWHWFDCDEIIYKRQDDGLPLQIFGVCHDITEAKQAEKALHENEIKYRTLFETANDAILLFAEGTWIDCNAGALRVFSCTREQIIGAHPNKFSPPTQPDGLSSEEEAIKRINLAFAGEPQFFEWEHCRADATPFAAEVNLNRVDLGGKTHILAIVRDVSERKQAEEKRKESETRLQSVLDNSNTVVFMKDIDGKYLLINRMYEKLFHVTKEGIVGKTDYDVFPKEIADKFREHDNLALAKGEAVEVVEEVPQEDGVHYYISAKFPLIDTNGKAYAVCGIATDYTEFRHKEVALLESEQKYRALVDNAFEGIVIINLEGTILFANNSILKSFEYERLDEIVGQNIFQFIAPEYVEQTINDFQKVMQGIEGEVALSCGISSKGNRIWMESVGKIIDYEGKKADMISIYDITLRKQFEEKLQLTEQRYRKLFEQANEGLILLTMDGEIAEVNQSFAQMHGYTVDEIKKMNIKDIDVLREDAFDARAEVMNSLIAGEVVRFEVEHYHKDGHIFAMSDTASLITIGGEKYFQAFHQDITDRKLAVEQLRESESRLKLAVTSGQIGIWDWKLKENVMIWDDRMFELYGITKDDFPNTIDAWTSGLHPEDKQMALDECNAALNGEKDFNTVFRVLHPNGKVLYLKADAIVVRDSNGEAIRMIGLNKDITETKKAEDELLEWNIRFKKLSANAPGLIFQFTRKPDGSYFVPIASEGIRDVFGCSPEDVVDDFTPIGNVIYPEDVARVIADIEHSAKHLTFFTCEFRVHIPGKEIQWIYSKSTPEKLADGSITWFGFNTDITEQKHIELELIKAKEKAEKSDQLKTAFLANMSHEIRTPMSGVLGFAKMLKKPNLSDEKQQGYIQLIEKSGNRMLNIINDIVDMSKIESGLMTVAITATNINDKVDFLYDFFKPEVEAKSMQLSAHKPLATEAAIINTDGDKLYAILANLIKNAIKYSNEGAISFGYILQQDDASKPSIEFYVKDTGIGIPANHHQSIFDRFIQVDIKDKMARQGAGLGLAICKAYVELLGGRIWLESEAGKGSTFRFTLPYHVSAK